MDDYRNMDRDDFKRNFPKILQQTIHQVGHPTGGAANGMPLYTVILGSFPGRPITFPFST